MGNAAYSRRELRARFRGWVRRNPRVVGLVTAGMVFVAITETWLLSLVESPEGVRWYLTGAMHALTIGAVPIMLFSFYLAIDSRAITHLRGAWGEENTRDVLKSARRKRLVWGWVNSINLRYGDIDHLVVTRRGGLVAIDSKWRNSFDVSDRDTMARSAELARMRAAGVVDTVLRGGRAGSRASGPSVRTRPVVVIWGAMQSEIPESAQAHGVDFVAGRNLNRWLKALDGDTIDKAAAGELLRRINAFKEGTTERATAH